MNVRIGTVLWWKETQYTYKCGSICALTGGLGVPERARVERKVGGGEGRGEWRDWGGKEGQGEREGQGQGGTEGEGSGVSA